MGRTRPMTQTSNESTMVTWHVSNATIVDAWTFLPRDSQNWECLHLRTTRSDLRKCLLCHTKVLFFEWMPTNPSPLKGVLGKCRGQYSISEMSTIQFAFSCFYQEPHVRSIAWVYLSINVKMSSYFSRMTSYHPYHPVDINLSGKYVENSFSPTILMVTFGTTWALVLGATLFAVRRFYPRLSIKDQGLVLWFILSKPSMRF